MIEEKDLIRGNLVRFRYTGNWFLGNKDVRDVVGYLDKITGDLIYVGNECTTGVNGVVINNTRKYKRSKIESLESKIST